MYKIINRHVYEIASGENITLCDIVADTSTDLPDADDQALYKIAFGSFAYVIDEGVFYSLDSSGAWNSGSYSDVVDEVITARGSFSSLDARLDDMDVILNSAKLGVKYKGAVNYYNDLPATGNEIGDAYTVKYAGSSGTTPDGTEYVWGELGGAALWIDFSKDCYTKSEINTMLAGKVNVEAGKGLSSNDFTDADKSKLGGIAAGAEVNVQSDWDQTDNTSDNFIKNKPTLGTAAAAAATDFATAAQGTKADSAIQSAGSGLSKNGTTLNHSNSITAKTTRAIRKLSFDAQGHISGSAELSAAESDALSSGIDSTKVAQIETNKNNISINANYGVKNRAVSTTIVSPSPDITVVQDGEGHYEISGDSGGVQRTIRIYDPSTPLECTEEMFVTPANTSENTTYACYWTLNDNDNYTTIPAQGLTIPIGAKINRLYIQVQANKIFDFVVNLMVCPKSLYDADPSYQPYAMSNAELTAAIQALQAQLANQ